MQQGTRFDLAPSSGFVHSLLDNGQPDTLTRIPAASVPLYQDLFKLYSGAPGISRAVPVTTGTGPLQDSTGHLGCGTQKFTGTYVNGSSGPQFGVNVPCAVAFGTNASSVNTESYVSGRVDYNINDKQKIYFRLSRDWGIQASATSPISPIFNQQSNQPWTIPQVNYTYSITPNLVNNFIASGNWYSAIFGVVNFPDAEQAFPGNFVFDDGGANGSANNTTGTGFANVDALLPTGRRGEQFQLIDDLSWSHGHHTIQAGVNDRNNRISDSTISSGSIIGTTRSMTSPTLLLAQ